MLRDIETLLRRSIDREVITGYEPDPNEVPAPEPARWGGQGRSGSPRPRPSGDGTRRTRSGRRFGGIVRPPGRTGSRAGPVRGFVARPAAPRNIVRAAPGRRVAPAFRRAPRAATPAARRDIARTTPAGGSRPALGQQPGFAGRAPASSAGSHLPGRHDRAPAARILPGEPIDAAPPGPAAAHRRSIRRPPLSDRRRAGGPALRAVSAGPAAGGRSSGRLPPGRPCRPCGSRWMVMKPSLGPL